MAAKGLIDSGELRAKLTDPEEVREAARRGWKVAGPA